MATLRVAAVCLGLVLSAPAAVEVRFVPPAADGTVSLGIYDASDRLVRVLCDEWPFNRFDVGLNGLSTSWDGNDASGQPVPAGAYHARGFVADAIGVEGEAVHFNDWMGDPDAPRIVSVAAAGILPDGDLLLAARLASEQAALVRYSPQGETRWRTLVSEPLAGRGGAVKLAVAAGRVFLLFSGKIRALDLETGRETDVPLQPADPRDISARGDVFAVLGQDAVKIAGADSVPRAEIALPSAGAVAIALLADGSLVAAAADGSLWHHGRDWKRLATSDGVKVRTLAPGRGETFWVLEETVVGQSTVAQYSLEDGRLAEWCSAVPGETPANLAASTGEDYFVAVLDAPQSNRTVAIRRGAVGGGWQLVTDKTITDSASFGWSDGQLSPVSGERPSSIEIALQENPLDPAAPRRLALQATAGADGTALATRDGLPVVRISDQPGFDRVMVLPGANSTQARFYQGDGACVEEFALTNLGAITSFDAGTIEMEGGAEKPAPPEDDPVPVTP